MKHCQDGILVYTESQEYYDCEGYGQCYGHYEIQPSIINGRPYFKMGEIGIWYTSGVWYIAPISYLGQNLGFAYYATDSFCPYQVQDQTDWIVLYASGWELANENLLISCK